MSLTFNEWVVTEVTSSIPIPFSFINESDVHLYLDGVELVQGVDYVIATPSTIQATTAPPSGSTVLIRRETNATTKAVDFQSGAMLTEGDLDTAFDQVFNLAQETKDVAIHDFNEAIAAFNAVEEYLPEINTVADDLGHGAITHIDFGDLTSTTAVPNSDSVIHNVYENLADIETVKDSKDNIDTLAGISEDVTTVAGISAEVGIVATTANLDVITIAADSGNLALMNTAKVIVDSNVLDVITDNLVTLQSAGTYAAQATQGATDAAVHLAGAALEAVAALSHKNAAAQSSVDANADAVVATAQAVTSTTKATEASASATAASTSASVANASEGVAATHASTASNAQTGAQLAESGATVSMNTAISEAATATTKAGEASTSAANSLVSEQNALASEQSASTSASTATTKASEANVDATTATTQAGIATTKAAEASASAASIDPAAINASISSLQTDVTTVQGDVIAVQTDVTANTVNVSTVQADVATVQTDVTATQVAISDLETQIQSAGAKSYANFPVDAIDYMTTKFTELLPNNVVVGGTWEVRDGTEVVVLDLPNINTTGEQFNEDTTCSNHVFEGILYIMSEAVITVADTLQGFADFSVSGGGGGSGGSSGMSLGAVNAAIEAYVIPRHYFGGLGA